MLEILALQVIAAILGTVSIGLADWLYQRKRIRRPLHSLWVASSSTAICLPLLTWTISVFLGAGAISWVLVSTLGAAMFFWMYRNLLKIPSMETTRPGQVALRSSGRPAPPPSNING